MIEANHGDVKMRGRVPELSAELEDVLRSFRLVLTERADKDTADAMMAEIWANSKMSEDGATCRMERRIYELLKELFK